MALILGDMSALEKEKMTEQSKDFFGAKRHVQFQLEALRTCNGRGSKKHLETVGIAIEFTGGNLLETVASPSENRFDEGLRGLEKMWIQMLSSCAE